MSEKIRTVRAIGILEGLLERFIDATKDWPQSRTSSADEREAIRMQRQGRREAWEDAARAVRETLGEHRLALEAEEVERRDLREANEHLQAERDELRDQLERRNALPSAADVQALLDVLQPEIVRREITSLREVERRLETEKAEIERRLEIVRGEEHDKLESWERKASGPGGASDATRIRRVEPVMLSVAAQRAIARARVDLSEIDASRVWDAQVMRGVLVRLLDALPKTGTGERWPDGSPVWDAAELKQHELADQIIAVRDLVSAGEVHAKSGIIRHLEDAWMLLKFSTEIPALPPRPRKS